MTPVDSFLHSVRGAFAPSYDTVWIWAVILPAVAALFFFGRWRAMRRRGRADAAAFAGFAADKRLTGSERELLANLAAGIGVSPLAAGTSLDVFERAGAHALAAETPTPASGLPRSEGASGEDIFARVHGLRRTLGFHVVSDHLALLTTRELVPGTHVAVGAAAGEVMEVNEAWFAVVAAPDITFAAVTAGTTARVTFTRDARYVTRCLVLAAEPPLSPRKLLFRHDEKPDRHQLRATVRVAAQGTVQLIPRAAPVIAGQAPGEPAVLAGELIDISLGGMAVMASGAVRPGTALHAALTWEGEHYRELPVAALRCDEKRGGFLVRFEFRGLPATEEARLAAAIARHSTRASHSEKDPQRVL